MGLIESTLPLVVFVAVQTFIGSVVVSVAVTAGTVGALCVIRLVRGGSLSQIVTGAVGALIGLLFALLSNDASNVVVPGLIINAAYALILGVSVAVAHPLSGYVIGAFQGEISAWRRRPELRRANGFATAAFAASSVVRLVVIGPLWLAHADLVVLGSVKLALGLPLSGVALLACYLILRPAYASAPVVVASDDAAASDDSTGGDGS